MYTLIDEPIAVGAVFFSGKITPRYFVWKGEKHLIEDITYHWHSKAGESRIFHFAVTNKGSVYEISYNLNTSNWKLDKIHE